MNRKLKMTVSSMLSAAFLLTACGSSQEAVTASKAKLTASDVVSEVKTDASKPESITIMVDGTLITQENGTGDCRDKFYANEYGIFTYWAGTWAKTLQGKLEEAGVDGELVTMPPLEETGLYLERVAPVWCITSACDNPSGVFKYFF